MADPTGNDIGSIGSDPAPRPSPQAGPRPSHQPSPQPSDAVASVKQDALAAAGQAKRQASSLLDQAKDRVITVAATQKDDVADRIDELAQSVHKAGEPFAGQQEWIADAIERGASELQSLATALRDNDVASLSRQIGSLAQRRPALFAGICLAGGLALARVGKLVAVDLSREDLPSLPEVGHGGN